MQAFEQDYNNHNSYSNSDETYSYQGTEVKIITVFKDGHQSIAIVEDENGDQFEVFKDQLY
jgi:hypothetical protein